MKKAAIIVLFLSLAVGAKAQFGISGGFNFTNYRYLKSGAKQSRNSIITYNVGMFYRTKGKIFCFQPSVDYTVKGARNYDVPALGTIDYYQNKLNYLQFTLPVFAKGTLVKDISFDFGMGPYFSLLTKGTSKAVSFSDGDKTTKFKIGNSSTDDFKPTDVGLSIQGGTRISHVGFYFIYDVGLSNVDPQSSAIIRTRAFRINMSIFF